MRKLKTLIRNVRKEYRADSALFDWDAAGLWDMHPRKQWEPDATGIHRARLISIHPNGRYIRATMCVKGDNYFK
jgi:hypothetical protein